MNFYHISGDETLCYPDQHFSPSTHPLLVTRSLSDSGVFPPVSLRCYSDPSLIRGSVRRVSRDR